MAAEIRELTQWHAVEERRRTRLRRYQEQRLKERKSTIHGMMTIFASRNVVAQRLLLLHFLEIRFIGVKSSEKSYLQLQEEKKKRKEKSD